MYIHNGAQHIDLRPQQFTHVHGIAFCVGHQQTEAILPALGSMTSLVREVYAGNCPVTFTLHANPLIITPFILRACFPQRETLTHMSTWHVGPSRDNICLVAHGLEAGCP